MPNPIVVGLDPEREDGAPLVRGGALARLTGAPLMVVGAYPHGPSTGKGPLGRLAPRDNALTRLVPSRKPTAR